MTRLQVYRGPEADSPRDAGFGDRTKGIRFDAARRFDDGHDAPAVLSLSDFITRRDARRDAVPIARAKALRSNCRCRFCDHPLVEPVTLNDGLRDGSGEYVPGSATLVGFHCERCDAEWPAFSE